VPAILHWDGNVHDLFSVRNMFFSGPGVLACFDPWWPVLNLRVACFAAVDNSRRLLE